MPESNINHNLNIHMYSLQEVLGLFDLSIHFSLEDLKRAKKKVLMLHPDKSKLSADYFLFYKKAFDIILQIYENNNKQNQTMNAETVKYKPISSDFNKATVNNVTTVIKEMKSDEFQSKFNDLFEKNMVNKSPRIQNEWFSKDEPIYNINEPVSTKNMGQVFDTIKDTQNGIVKYRGVQDMIYSDRGSNLYDEDIENDSYVTSDPFSKLKFDDLRKVHKDQTVFSVSERDFNKVQQYSSVDHMMRERGKDSLTPLEKHEAEQMLAMKDTNYRQRMMQKEHDSYLKTMEYAEKNKQVLSSFLQLENK